MSIPLTTQDRLREFYAVYNPVKLNDVENILRKYEGREQDLFEILEDQYDCLEPWKVRNKYRGPLIKIYEKYNPDKTGDVDYLLLKYCARQEEMVRKLKDHYKISEEEFEQLINEDKAAKQGGQPQQPQGAPGSTNMTATRTRTITTTTRGPDGVTKTVTSTESTGGQPQQPSVLPSMIPPSPLQNVANPNPSISDVQKALRDGDALLREAPRVITDRELDRIRSSTMREPPYREVVQAILLTLDPNLAKDVDLLLRNWHGREIELIEKLKELQEQRRQQKALEVQRVRQEESAERRRQDAVMHEVVTSVHEAEACRPRIRREIREICEAYPINPGTLITVNIECSDSQNAFFPANTALWGVLRKIADDTAIQCEGARNTSVVRSSHDNSTLRVHNGVLGVFGNEWSSVMPHSVSVLDPAVGGVGGGQWHFYNSEAFWRQWEKNVLAVL
eukprot:PhF_6_TR35743/c0_g1_i1/m.51908